MTRTARRICLSLVGVFLLAAAGHAARGSSLPPGFSDMPVSRPDGQPWQSATGVAFADDGRMFVWERGGRVWLLAATRPLAQPLIDLSTEVSTIGSLGLTGFALDPQFAQNGYIYLFYAVDPQHLANCDSPTAGAAACRITYRQGQHAASGATLGRVVRYQLLRLAGAPDYHGADTVNYASRQVLLGETASAGQAPTGCVITDTAHGTGGLAFGSDGTLFVGCGDGASVTDEDSGSDPHTQYREALGASLMTAAENVGAFRAQLVDSLSGKILRLDAETGDGVASNPFYDAAAPRAARSRVWLLGLHDPQHFTVRPGSGGTQLTDGRPGTLYIGDVGFSTWESLVVARDGRMNFGWPLYEGVGDDTTDYAALTVFNLLAPNPLFPSVCRQQYLQFRDLIIADPVPAASWPNPCQPATQVPAADDLFIRDRPAIDWLHAGAVARWAASTSSGEPLALTLGTPAESGAVVAGPLFGGLQSVGGVWYQSSRFPLPFRNVYYHADTGGEWIKAFTFDANDAPVAVSDFLASGGPIRAVGTDPHRGELYYITGSSGSEVHRLSYSPTLVPQAVAAKQARASSTTTAPVVQARASAAAVAPIARVATPSISKPTAPTRTAQARFTAAASGTTGWGNQDIGTVSPAGSYSVSGSTFTVNGSGADIWNTADAFQFVYQPINGNGSITARVVSQSDSDAWAKAGVMFRETLTAGATNADTMTTPGNGVVFQARGTTGAQSGVDDPGPDAAAPYWVRVVRSGNTFSGYASPDGNTWTLIGQTTIAMATQAYVGLAVTSHNEGTLSTVVFDNVTIVSSSSSSSPQAPTVPTGLAASNVTSSSVTLSWNASTNSGSSGVGGYYVYRNGGTTPLATVTSGTTYTDTSVSAATTYTYQVAAFDTSSPPLVSAPCTAVSVTTPAAGTASWSNQDIGTVSPAGSYSVSGGTFTVKGSGADIWNAADAFQFVYQPINGNGSITARVVSQSNSNAWAKAGVMFRETLTPGATNADTLTTPGNGVVFQARGTTGAQSGVDDPGPDTAAPYWVRVVRSGTTFTGYASPDGNTWTLVGQTTIAMATQAYVGLAVTSHNEGTLSTVVFDNVTIVSSAPQAPTVPTGLAASNVTSSSVTLSWNASTNSGSSGVGGYYVYRNGGTTPLATVTSGTTYTDTSVSAATTYSYQVAAFDTSSPALVSAPCTAVSVTTPPASTSSWSNQDIGTVSPAGSFSANGSTYTVKGSGADIWNAADAFQFVYQPINGNGTITARVVSQSNTNAWAKAGVMFRETLSAGATNAATLVTPGNGVVFQPRASTGAQAGPSTTGPDTAAPYWVRVVRSGNTFTGYASPDGNTWTLIAQSTFSMATQAYVGLAVTSHDEGTLSTAVFDNVTITTGASSPEAPSVPTGLAASNVTSSSVTLSWNASTNSGSSGVAGYYVYRNSGTTPLATLTSGTTYTDTSVSAATTYSYQVAAFDTSNPPLVSSLSTAINVTTSNSGTTSSWTDQDIGTVSPAGSYSMSGSTFTVNGSGADIWNPADAFQFVYQPINGNGTITARVVSQTNTNSWAKAGVMFRETLSAGATNAATLVTPGNGVVFQPRASTGAQAGPSTTGPDTAAPYWVRVVRSGNTFSGYASPDGNTWTLIAQTTFSMATQAYVGLAVTSHDEGTLSTAVFDNVTVEDGSLTPQAAGIAPWQTQQFTVPFAGGATWTVDGVAGGNSTVGTITSSGLYTPGSAGAHTIVATSTANASVTSVGTVGVTNLGGVYTYHNDMARDGANAQEYALTPSNVNTAGFGKLFSCTADGAIYAQPLWVAGVNIAGTMHNVVFVATEHNSLFAYDADATPCQTLWSVSLIDTNHGATSGETTVPAGPTGNLVGVGDGDISPEVGITGTPVIDPSTGTLYVVSKSVSANQSTFYQRLHAIDITTGKEKSGSPVAITGSVSSTSGSVTFNPQTENQRAGLAFNNGTVYIAWAAHEDADTYYGWVIAYTYNGASFTQSAVFNDTPNVRNGGIWMSGGAPAIDEESNVYVITGNGAFDASNSSPPNTDYGDSFLQLGSGLKVTQYYTPQDQQTDANDDGDFGSGGAVVLADLPAGSPVTHIAMGGGKDGNLMVLNRDSMGGYDVNGNLYWQQIHVGSIFATGAYWNDTYYLAPAAQALVAYQLNTTTAQFSLASTANTPTNYGWPGSGPSVSASGLSNGIVWGLSSNQYCTKQSSGCGPAVLYAYDATNLATELWDSTQASGDAAGNAVKFTVPTVANGKVYVGTRGNNTGGVYGSTTVSGELDVYGLKPN